MKKLLLSITYSLLLLGFCNAQNGHKEKLSGNGNVSTEIRNVAVFTRVEAADGIDVYVTQSDQNKVEVEADENLIPHILTEVHGKGLRIYTKKRFLRAKKLRVNVWIKNVEAILASGGSDVYSKSVISATNLSIKGSGGSDLELEVNVKKLDCMVSGGSDVDLKGSTNHCKMMASGGSDIQAYELKSSVCHVDASGGSDAFVTVMSEIDVTASGGSDIYYKGDAKVVHKSVSGSSDVYHR